MGGHVYFAPRRDTVPAVIITGRPSLMKSVVMQLLISTADLFKKIGGKSILKRIGCVKFLPV